MIINKCMNKKKKIANFFAFLGILLFVIFTLTAATLTQEKTAIAEKEATYKTALAESLNPCDGTHTNYTVVSTSGGTISSSGNYYLNGEVIGTIKIDAINVTLCLNGHDINAANADLNAVEITKDNFTLHDCGSHTRYYKIDSATKLATFDGATETDNDGSIKGGAIRGGRNNGIQSLGKTVNLLGGNVISANLRGVAISGGNVKISDMSFIGNNGGGINVGSTSANTIVNISNSYILHNNSNFGGGINITDGNKNDDKTVEVTINDSFISHNSAIYTGGGVRSNDSILSISNSQINKNISKGGQGGGGINISGGETATLTDVTISENTSNSNGGGLCVEAVKIRLGGVMIIDRNMRDGKANNLLIKSGASFDQSDILSANSLIAITYQSETNPMSTNINSLNLAYIKADDPTKMIVADNSGGLLYKNKPKITFKENIWDNTGKNTQPFVPNEPFNLSQNPFTKDGYSFLGWSKAAHSIISYVEAQANVIISEDVDIELYPFWHENHDGIEFMPVYELSDISDSGGNYVITSMFTKGDITLSSGTTNFCISDRHFWGNITVNGNANLNIFGEDSIFSTINKINVESPLASLTINSGRVKEISIIQSKDIFINGGSIVKMTALAGDFSSNSVGKIHISGSPTFGSNESQNAVIIISTAYDSFGTVTRGATLVLNNGKTGSERISYSGTPIKVALDYAKGKPAPLYGQVVAEDVSEIQQELIELVAFDSETLNYRLVFDNERLIVAKLADLFEDSIKFYRNNLWDTFRSPAYPSSNRPFHLYNLSAPFDAQMNKIDFTNGKYVKFQQNNTYTTVNDLPIEDKNRIVNSLKFSSYSSEQAILNALIVSEVMYNADGTINRILANIGLIWSLGEQGFLYTSLDGDGAFPFSGGIGTYVTFKAHNDGDSLVDTAPKDDPLSKDDFDPDGDGIGNIEIPSVPDIHPPANNEIYISYIGKVIDNNGNALKNISVRFTYFWSEFSTTTDVNGYFIVPNILLTKGQDLASVSLVYSVGGTYYGEKTYDNMPIKDEAIYIYPLTSSDNDGSLSHSHSLTPVNYIAPTCKLDGNLAYFICKDTACGCGKIFGDLQGQKEITLTEIYIAKIPHLANEIPALDATCTQTGLSAGSKCSLCNEILIEQTEIPMLSHTEEEISAVIATCTQSGLTAGSKCTVCNLALTEQTEIPMLGHTVEEISAVTATCTQNGLTAGSKCTVCKEILTEQTKVPMLGHTVEEISAVTATCTQSGLTAGSMCTVCNLTLTEQTEIPILSHTEEVLLAVTATCTQSGLTAGSKCTVCNLTLTEQTEIPMLGHTVEEISAVTATCTQSGLTAGSKCTICNEILTVQNVLPIEDHTYNNGEVTLQPTNDTEGEKTYTCTSCGHIKLENIPKLTVEEKDDISLLWLIIMLAIINLLELIAIVLLICKNRKYKKSKKGADLKSYSVLPLILLSGQGLSHLALIIILGITAILQAVIIIILVLKHKNKLDKKIGKIGEIEVKFNLSRQDVIDRIEESVDFPQNFPIASNLSERKTESSCDCLRCGEWTFALMYESKSEIIKFMLRLEDGYAKQLMTIHPCITNSAFGEGENWYKVIVDDSFNSKAEVFALLDAAYAFVLNKRYTYNFDTKTYETDANQANKDKIIAETVASEAEKTDGDIIKLENKRDAFNTLLLARLIFKPSKIEIAESVIAEFPTCEIEAAQRPNATVTNLPLADTFYSPIGISDKGESKKVCFGYSYQLKDGTIKIILKLPKIYAERQAETHKTLCRSKFPKGKGWYVFRIDNSFTSMTDLMPLFHEAKHFVENTENRD